MCINFNNEIMLPDDDWIDYRETMLKEAKEREESIIKRWLSKIGCKDTVGYYCSIVDRTMTIYTNSPGRLIGKQGINVKEFKSMLSEEFGGEWKVLFTVIRGGFVTMEEE